MKVRHADPALEKLEADASRTEGHSPAIVKAFRNRLNFIRNCLDERDLYAWKSLRFKALQGARSHQHSIRLNDQWRLIIEFEGESPNKTAVIVSIEDYH